MAKTTLAEKGWGTDSGLPEDFVFAASEAWFGPNEEATRDVEKVYLHLRGPAFEDGEQLGDDDGYTLRYPTGKNWDVVKNGKAVEHITGSVKFNRQSGCGHLVDGLLGIIKGELPGAAELEVAIDGRGLPTEAATFVGLAFRFKRTVVSKFKSEEGEDVEWQLPLPVEFLGEGEDALSGGSKKKAKGAVAAKASKVPKPVKSDGAKKLRAAVVEFARKYDTDEHEDFSEEVLDPDTFDSADEIGEALRAEILDADSKLWAEAHDEEDED